MSSLKVERVPIISVFLTRKIIWIQNEKEDNYIDFDYDNSVEILDGSNKTLRMTINMSLG